MDRAKCALYNQCANNARLATAVISAVKDFDPKLIIYCLSGSVMAEIATQLGLTVYHEVFADRNYNGDGEHALQFAQAIANLKQGKS